MLIEYRNFVFLNFSAMRDRYEQYFHFWLASYHTKLEKKICSEVWSPESLIFEHCWKRVDAPVFELISLQLLMSKYILWDSIFVRASCKFVQHGSTWNRRVEQIKFGLETRLQMSNSEFRKTSWKPHFSDWEIRKKTQTCCSSIFIEFFSTKKNREKSPCKCRPSYGRKKVFRKTMNGSKAIFNSSTSIQYDYSQIWSAQNSKTTENYRHVQKLKMCSASTFFQQCSKISDSGWGDQTSEWKIF